MDILNAVLMFAVVFGLGWAIRYGKKHKIGEARFDSKTGKQIRDE